MRLSYDNLLYHLSLEWMEKLLHSPSLKAGICNKKERQKRDFDIANIESDVAVVVLLRDRKRKLDISSSVNSRKRGKYKKRKLYFTDPNTGKRSVMTYDHSVWWQRYIVNAQSGNPTWEKKFRKRFRLPYESFLDLVEECKESSYFQQWWGTTYHYYNKKRPVPLQLLVLSVLRYLGRGWTMDDLEEVTVINEETIRQFIHQFIEFGSTTLYNKYVKAPLSTEELKDCAAEYTEAGLPGTIGSTDATHIVIEKCAYRLRQLHLGYKLTHTARTYNLTVNHHRRILSSTSGHPSTFNDKSLILFDDFCHSIKDGIYDDKYEFELYDYDRDGKHIKMKYRGCWLIVDNGYLNWSITVPPLKSSVLRREIRFSEWIESMCKDVECAFGILKGRWRCLKYGIRLKGHDNCDKLWLTCCALHNKLLEIDGLSEQWMNGIPSDWETEVDDYDSLPFSLKRLSNPGTCRNFDISGMGMGNDVEKDGIISEMEIPNFDKLVNRQMEHPYEVKCVKDLPLSIFRQNLIRHFNIAFIKNEIKWPKRMREKQADDIAKLTEDMRIESE